MTLIPENTVTQADLAAWYEMQDKLKALKASEMLLRTKIFKHYFPVPKEGTNTAPLDNGWVIKGVYKISREPDPALLAAFAASLREQGINPDTLVKYKPELITKTYRELTEEQVKLFDRVLVVKPSAPSLEIVLPAKAKAS
jgi:hypothetical protein